MPSGGAWYQVNHIEDYQPLVMNTESFQNINDIQGEIFAKIRKKL